MRRRDTLLALLTASLAARPGAQAQTRGVAPRYAVLSLIGSKLNLVTVQMSTGRMNDANLQQSVSLPTAPFDNQALAQTQDLLQLRTPPSTPLLYASASAALLAPGELFDGKKLLLPPELSAGMKSDGATHLLLLTRQRREANIQFTGSKLGRGQLAGLGFYIDRTTRVTDTDSGESSLGFIAPYAYLRLSLVELASANVLGQHEIAASKIASTKGENASIDPWEALTPVEKISLLSALLVDALTEAVPKVLASMNRA